MGFSDVFDKNMVDLEMVVEIMVPEYGRSVHALSEPR